MAADTPFGLSFGNPSKYMGQSPLAEVGKAVKTGLIGYGIQKSGLESWLNQKGMDKNKAPAGAVAPVVPSINQQAPVMPSDFGASPIAPPQAQTLQPVNPASDSAGVVVNPVPEVNFSPPPDIGERILNDNWYEPVSDLTNKTDFNPVAQQTGYNQMLVTGNEYQQAPGYGKLAQTLQTMFGMG
jgi:hypothetical protein